MFTLNKGDCEHCSRTFHYLLWHAGFGDFSYAYCDSCGMLATITYSTDQISKLPTLSAQNREIDAAWEPFLRSCDCGGHFRRGAAPRCVHCNSALSPEYAASYIERNSTEKLRGWHWQRNWSEEYCIAIEDPRNPGTLRQMVDPILDSDDSPPKKQWRLSLHSDR